MKRNDSNECGIALLIVAFSLFACIGFVALAIDSGFLLNRHLRLQAAYDAGALRGAFSLFHGETDQTKVVRLVQGIVKANLLVQGADSATAVSVSNASHVDIAPDGKKVHVYGAMTQQYWFAQIFPGMGKSKSVSATSVASFTNFEDNPPPADPGSVVVVADVSDSMNESYHHAVTYLDANGVPTTKSTKKAALVSAVQMLVMLMNGQTLAIVDFAPSCHQIFGPAPITDDYSGGFHQGNVAITNRQAAMLATVKLLNTSSGTNINCGLALGGSLLPQMPSPKSVMLLTDGMPTDSTTSPGSLMTSIEEATGIACNKDNIHSDTVNTTNWIRSMGVRVNAVGIGDGTGYDSSFLKILSADPSGSGMSYLCKKVNNVPINITALPNPAGTFTEALDPADLYGALTNLGGGNNSVFGPRLVNS